MSRRWLLLPVLAACAGCRRAQSYSLLGSYFPAWLFCIAAGIGVAGLVYLLLERRGLGEQLQPPLLIYPALALACTLGFWLALYS